MPSLHALLHCCQRAGRCHDKSWAKRQYIIRVLAMKLNVVCTFLVGPCLADAIFSGADIAGSLRKQTLPIALLVK